jgi:hypothetical protein
MFVAKPHYLMHQGNISNRLSLAIECISVGAECNYIEKGFTRTSHGNIFKVIKTFTLNGNPTHVDRVMPMFVQW